MKKRSHNTIEMLQFDGLNRFCNISHFISTRRGGVSENAYSSFNLGTHCGDKPEAAQANRTSLCTSLHIQPDQLFVPFQIHKSEVAILDKTFLALSKEQQQTALDGIDAMITNVPGVFPAVSTADCVPILLYAADKQVVAAIHAGWRSTVLQIAIKTVRLMTQQFQCNPSRIWAGIGPSIGKEAFEVGEEVGVAFQEIGSAMHAISYRDPQGGKLHIDLGNCNRLQLRQAGLLNEQIETADMCTFSHPDLFFSARRDGIASGRMLSGIGITSGNLNNL